jgi:hypothetical protein
MKNGSGTCGSAGTSHSARQSLSTTPTRSVVTNAMVAWRQRGRSAGSSTLRVNSSAMTIQVERAHRRVCAQVATRVVSELCQIPCETPTKQRDLQGHAEAHRCCGNSLRELRYCVLVCVSTRRRNRFPSVLLPLGHLSVWNQQLAVSPASKNPNCVRRPNGARSLTVHFEYSRQRRLALVRAVFPACANERDETRAAPALAEPKWGQPRNGGHSPERHCCESLETRGPVENKSDFTWFRRIPSIGEIDAPSIRRDVVIDAEMAYAQWRERQLHGYADDRIAG